MFLGLDQYSDKSPVPGCEALSVAQMRKADSLAIAAGTPGYDLMTAAGQSVANIVREHYPDHAVLVLCGSGNNGGDGFVAARFLADMGQAVTVMALVPGRKFKGDARQAFRDWPGSVSDFRARPDMPPQTVVVDAVFGTGLSKPLDRSVAALFDDIRAAGWPVVAVDIPSGVDGDSGACDPAALAAAHTVTFFRKKTGHLLMPGLALCGHVTVHDIGIGDAVLAQTGFELYENAPPLWAQKLPQPKTGAHKYDRGHLVVLGGARMTGAGRLVSEAAMRIGAGLCTVVAPVSAAEVYRRAAPHVMVEDLKTLAAFGDHLQDSRRNAAVLGPGAGLEDAAGLRQAVLAALGKRLGTVLDADGLSCFADDPSVLHAVLHERCVLTPHEGEFARVFPAVAGGRRERAQAAAELTGAVILLKGPDTVIVQRGRTTVINTHATPWLATAGAGDVLAGIIGGLIAQGLAPFDAACAAAWIHGEAASRKGPGLVAPDIIEHIPGVIRDLA